MSEITENIEAENNRAENIETNWDKGYPDIKLGKSLTPITYSVPDGTNRRKPQPKPKSKLKSKPKNALINNKDESAIMTAALILLMLLFIYSFEKSKSFVDLLIEIAIFGAIYVLSFLVMIIPNYGGIDTTLKEMIILGIIIYIIYGVISHLYFDYIGIYDIFLNDNSNKDGTFNTVMRYIAGIISLIVLCIVVVKFLMDSFGFNKHMETEKTEITIKEIIIYVIRALIFSCGVIAITVMRKGKNKRRSYNWANIITFMILYIIYEISSISLGYGNDYFFN